MSERGSTSFLAILLGLFAAASIAGLVVIVAMSWVLNKSFEAVVGQLLSDTGGSIFAELPEEEEDGPSPLDEPDEAWEPAEE